MRKIFFIAIIVILVSCQTKKSDNKNAFYYWKTSFSFDSYDDSIAKSLNVNTFYIRYLDVDWSEAYGWAVPKATLTISNYDDYIIPENIIPCVFITNQVFVNITKDRLNELADKISKLIESKNIEFARDYAYKSNNDDESWNDLPIEEQQQKQNLANITEQNKWLDNIKEIQIDCDWTLSTKDKYFEFLKLIKKKIGKRNLSATLRLWQFKNIKIAGVPPVNRCMLMCYSLSSPKEYNTPNSIFTIDEFKKYLSNETYPLALDYALPVYNWGILFRNKQFKGIIGEIDEIDIKMDTNTYRKISENV